MNRPEKKGFFIGMIGNVLEHYDGALYAMLAPFLAPLFFPGDFLQSLIFTYAILPLGMIFRPLGSILFGYIGDRLGRKTALFYSLLGMALVTTLMGFLPTYKAVGYFAPILLALGRILQNFFAAGEVIGGAIFVLERSQKNEKSFLSSLYDCSSILGILLASFGVYILSGSNWIDPGWRVLFFLGSSAGWVGLIIRSRADEPKIFRKEIQKTADIKSYLKEFCAIIVVSGFSYTLYSISTSFFNAFVPLVSTVSKTEIMQISTYVLFIDLCTLPMFGYLAEKISKERVMMLSSLIAILLAIPLFWLMKDASYLRATSIRIVFVLIGVSFSAPFHFWAIRLLPSEYRYLLISLGYAIGSQTIGGSASFMGLWLYKKTGSVVAPASYVILSGLLAMYFVYQCRTEKAQQENLI